MTVEPRSACVFSPGWVPITSPLGTVSDDRSRTRTSKPAASRRRARRRASVCPSTSGTVAVPGPSETVSVTTEPSSASRARARDPGRGPGPSGCSDVLATVSTREALRAAARPAAVARSPPTTFGTTTWSLRRQQQRGEQHADGDEREQREQPPAAAGAVVLAPRRGGGGRRRPNGAGCAGSRRPTRRPAAPRTVASVGGAGVREQARARGGERGDERVGVGVAARRVLLQRAQHDLLELGRDRRRCRRSAAPGASPTCLSAIVTALSPSNGTRPVSIS